MHLYIFALFLFASQAFALQCHSCDSPTDKGCGDPLNKTASEDFLTECKPLETRCMKVVATSNIIWHNGDTKEAAKIVSRLCAEPNEGEEDSSDYCRRTAAGGGGYTEICFCGKDQCNNAVIAAISIATLLSSVIMVLALH